MDNELPIKESNILEVDYLELLTRIILSCNDLSQSDPSKTESIKAADIISAAYYFRRYPDVDDFIEKFLKKHNDYFQLQWIRSAWSKFHKLSEEELSELVIDQICLVANLEEEQ